MTMRADHIWMNGTIIPWDEAKVHVFTHALHYSGVTPGAVLLPGVARLMQHLQDHIGNGFC